jgi:hypothetical protein
MTVDPNPDASQHLVENILIRIQQSAVCPLTTENCFQSSEEAASVAASGVAKELVLVHI